MEQSSGTPRRPLPPLAGGLAVLALAVGLVWAYWPTLLVLIHRWNDDPQYSHGYVVPLFALFVLWARRDRFPSGAAGTTRAQAPWGLGGILLGIALRLAGGFFHFQWLDTASLLPTLAGLVLIAGGWPLLRWAWPGLVLGFFMLPLPYQLELFLAFPLRRLAALVSCYALQTLGIPALAEGNIIVIDELRIGVAEACSGLGMLMTFFALSTAVALAIRRPWYDKLVLFLSAVPIGVGLNVLRVAVTTLLFRFASGEVARLVFHDLAGWIMMPLALGVLWLELCWLRRLVLVEPRTGPVRVSSPLSSSPTHSAPAPAQVADRPGPLPLARNPRPVREHREVLTEGPLADSFSFPHRSHGRDSLPQEIPDAAP